MKFRTEVDVAPPGYRLHHGDRFLSLGSCFAENMAERLAGYRFRICVNPFGVLYNPASLADALGRLLDRRPFARKELTCRDDRWFSFRHHGRFSSRDPEACLSAINVELEAGAKALREARLLILTFGTAFVYTLASSGEVVANCHKLPDREFQRRRLEAREIVNPYLELLPRLKALNPELEVLITVSPVRHWKDGAALNQLSKSTLIVAAHTLRESLDFVGYFPAYELMMDDLRDYRFYAEDMIHPSPVAIDYIWSRFSEAYLDRRCAPIMAALEKLTAARGHRPRDPGSAAHRQFLEARLADIEALEAREPALDLSADRDYFRRSWEEAGG